jgi:hypothetical protein
MSIEDELRDSLRRRAASVDAQPDLDDVVERTAHRDRRTRRLLTTGLVVALIAGPLAGFAIGRADDRGGSDVATGGGREFAATAGDAPQSSLAVGVGGPLEKLFFRTSADGVEIRAYRSAPTATDLPAPACGPGEPCPAPECSQTVTTEAMITGELSTDAAVAVATGSAGETSGDDPDLSVSSGSWGSFGVAEAAPARWVIASVNESVVRVRATFPGGTVDEMEPVDGVAILASRVADPDAAGATLEGLAADGSVVKRIDVTPGFGGMATGSSSSSSAGVSADARAELRVESSAGGSSSSANARSSVSSSASGAPDVAASCVSPPTPQPPVAPTLPAPGDQPADPAAARDEIERVYTVALDGSVHDDALKIATVEDGARLLATMQAAAQGPNGAAAQARVDDITFTSPTEASVRFAIVVPGSTTFEGMTGRAVFTDGTWKVARETVCQTVSLAGAVCPPAK